jgi:molecular chaperone GrpE
MEHDPKTTPPAAEEAAGAPGGGESTDGVRTATEPTPPVAPPDGGDGAAGPEAHAAAAGVAQAAEPEPEVAAAQAEREFQDKYLRAMAELDNVRKRARRDVAQAEARGIAKLARELLPALDNFARALDAAEAQPENRDHHLTDGIRLVQNELLSALARVGIEPDSPKGQPFDPHCHEAIAQQPVEGAKSGTIVEVYSQGYRYRDDVLRPAKVVVAA